MTDINSLLIKLISSAFSLKSAIKIIFICIALFLCDVYLPAFISKYTSFLEHAPLLILLFGFGSGIIIFEMIYFVFSKMKLKIKN